MSRETDRQTERQTERQTNRQREKRDRDRRGQQTLPIHGSLHSLHRCIAAFVGRVLA